MAAITILRRLWRLRLAVAFVCLLSLVAGVASLYRISFPPNLESRRYDAGTATVRILVDTPSSQVIDVAPRGSDTVSQRALLLANLMVDGVVENAIARRAGLIPDQLTTIGPSGAATSATPVEPESGDNVLKTQVLTDSGGSLLPIIQVDTHEPTAEGATRLANAAVAGVREYLGSQAALERIPEARRLRVKGLGSAQGQAVVRGPSKLAAFVAMLMMVGFGCGLILLIDALARAWRTYDDGEALGPEPFAGDPLDGPFDEEAGVGSAADREHVNGWSDADEGFSAAEGFSASPTARLYDAPAREIQGG